MVKCPDLKALPDSPVKLGDFLKYNTDLMFQYNECALVHDGLVDAVGVIQEKGK
jgi:hypothetical protein